MKLNLKFFLVFILILFVFSCKRDYEFDANASIVGTWKPIQFTVYDYVGGIRVSKSLDATACQQQSKMVYNTDLTATETRYEDVSGNCEKTLERNFTYTYNPSTKSLVHTFSDGSAKTAEVLSITSNTLIVKGKKDIGGTLYDLEVKNVKLNQ